MSAREPVGSAAEEATRLAEVLHAWWGERGGTGAGGSRTAPSARAQDAAADDADGAEGAHDAESAHDAGAEDAGTPSTCRYCPLCRGAAVVHAVRPEVLTHLLAAAESVAAALRELASETQPAGRPHADPSPAQAPGRRSVRIPVEDADGVEDVESQEGH